MSTTIDRFQRGARFCGAASLVLVAWFLLAAVATLTLEPTRTVAVFAPSGVALPALVHAEARLLDAGAGFILVQGQGAGFVRRLYAGGGWLVLPAAMGGCRGDGAGRLPVMNAAPVPRATQGPR